jgi:hypothetical protein
LGTEHDATRSFRLAESTVIECREFERPTAGVLRFEEWGELHDAIEGIGHAVAATNAEIDRGGERLTQQSRLAKPGSPSMTTTDPVARGRSHSFM